MRLGLGGDRRTRLLTEAGLLLAAALDVVLSASLKLDLSFALSAAAVLVLPLRHRFPRAALLVALAGLLTGYAIIATMVAMLELASVRRPRWEMAGAISLVAIAYLLPWPLTAWGGEHTAQVMSDLLYGLLVGAGPAGLGLLIRTRLELDLRLRQLAASQEEEKRLHAQQVLAEDRARLAREMHDLVSHQVMLISAQASGLSAAARDDLTSEMAATIQGLAAETLQELRFMVGMLRDPAGSHIAVAPGTLLADIERLVAASGLSCRLHLDVPDEPPPEPVQHAAYRIVQEALTNVAKHAPGAPTSVLVARTRNVIVVEVRNGAATEPPAAPPSSGGFGLIGLRERAEELGGGLQAWRAGDGFAVRAELPDGTRPDPASGPYAVRMQG